MWWLPHKFAEKAPYLAARREIVKAVRGFFEEEGFWEVETPALQTSPTMDTHIHGFRTELFGPDLKPERELYLHTSPEFAMKKLLVAGAGDIYQIAHVFRNGETTSLHSPEFTLLEWYSVQQGYEHAMDLCVRAVRSIAGRLGIHTYTYRKTYSNPFLNWDRISVQEAFEKYADINLIDFTPPPLPSPQRGEGWEGGIGQFRAKLDSIGIRTAPDDRWDDLFFRVMAEKIEPHLGIGTPTILYDYPANMAALARRKSSDPRFAERFEVYVCGVELANGFGELTDPAEQRARFLAEMAAKKEIYGLDYPVDEDFLKAIEYGLPECAGVALGLDRLVMLATGAEDIEQVLWNGRP